MNSPLKRLSRLALASLPLCMLFVASPVRAEDGDSDHPKRPGFFQRLGNSIFRGTRKLERSDTIDPATGGHGTEDGTLPSGSTTRRSKTTTTSSTTTTPRRRPGTAPINAADPVYPSSASTVSSASGDPDAARRLKPKHAPALKNDEPAPKTSTTKKGSEQDQLAAKEEASAQDKDKDKGKDGGHATHEKDKDEYPLATKGHTSGFLKSPFPPYNELDARGMVSGTLAKDPTTGKIFRVP